MSQQIISRYQIIDEIGRGGMATVYRAFDPLFKRDVAVKIMAGEHLTDKLLRARFEREAQTIAALEHPAIVPVYDFGEDDDRLFLIMRLMTGGTLTDRLKHGALSIKDTSIILQRIGGALSRAHAKGVIHRDLKPSNVLFDEYGDAFLADFGIARITESTVTLTGQAVVGTPAYMSPEQIYGDKNIDGRSDIYALGVICFEMLTGQRPYQDDTPAKVMMKHVIDPIPDIRQVMPNLPVGIDVVIARTMAKAPDERYSTANEMTDSLEAISRPGTSQAAPVVLPAPEQPLPEDQPTSPPISPVLEVAADLAVAGAAVSDQTELAPPMEVSPPDITAEHPETEISPPDFDTRPEPIRAPDIVQEEPLPETEVARPIFPTKPEDPKKSPLRNPILLAGLAVAAFIILAGVILAATGVFSPDQEGTAQADVTESARVETVSSAGDTSDEEPVVVEDQYDAQPSAAAPEDQRDQALAFMEEAYALFDKGDYDAAVERASMAIELDPEYADHYFQRGQLFNWIEDYHSAIDDLNRAIELEPRTEYYFERGIAYRGSDDSDRAIEDFHQAIELEPDNPAPYIDLGAVYRSRGDFDVSLDLLSVSIGLDPDSARALTERAKTFDEMGDFEASLGDSLRAYELTPEDPWIAEHIAEIYAWGLGDWDRALVYFNLAIDQNPEEAWRFTARAITLRMLGDGEAAIADHDRAIELEPSESWHRIEKAYTLQDRLEDPEGAIRVLEEAMEIGPEDPELYVERAQIRANDLGDYEGAIADADMAIELDPGTAGRYGFRAGLLREMGDRDAALADYIRATEFDTTDAWSFIDLGYFYYDDLGEVDPAFDAWNIAVEREPDNPDAYHARYLYFAHVVEDFDAAISDLSRCLELDPEKAWCYWERAWLFDTIEDIGGALEDFQRFLELIDVEECPECVQEASEFIESHS